MRPMKLTSARRRNFSVSAQDVPMKFHEDLNSVITMLKKDALSNPP
jgi:hypothetical protein